MSIKCLNTTIGIWNVPFIVAVEGLGSGNGTATSFHLSICGYIVIIVCMNILPASDDVLTAWWNPLGIYFPDFAKILMVIFLWKYILCRSYIQYYSHVTCSQIWEWVWLLTPPLNPPLACLVGIWGCPVCHHGSSPLLATGTQENMHIQLQTNRITASYLELQKTENRHNPDIQNYQKNRLG